MPLDSTLWSQFSLDPRLPEHRAMRASDHDRAVTMQALTEAYAEGRLDLAEHDERAGAAAAARTLGDLSRLLGDLVPLTASTPAPLVRADAATLRGMAERDYAQQRRKALMGFLAPSVICWTIWLATTPGGFPWPAIVMAATLINLMRVLVTRADLVEEQVRRLEKKQAKELAKQARRPALGAPRERLDPEAVRAVTDAAKQRAKDAARAVEQDVVRRVNERFRPPPPPPPPPPTPPSE